MNKRAQVAIFVIVAVVVVGAIIAFVAFRDQINLGSVPKDLQPVFELYHQCLEQEARHGLEIVGAQGGRIDTGAYVPGSDYAPFGSHLSYLGYGIPYWYTVQGNNIGKENVPTLASMQSDIAGYIEDHVKDSCDFSSFYQQGYYIDLSTPTVNAVIDQDSLDLNVRGRLSVSRGDQSATEDTQKLTISTKLGSFYSLAKNIYAKQKADAFLENYAVDVLRSYAPVDGVNVQCSPTTWKTQDVVNGLYDGLEANFAAIKFKGSYYTQSDPYFVVDQQVGSPVQVVYSKNWPSKIEITPASNELMVAEPIGNQQGLGVLGFCYVPYHFVYDISFPTLFQIYDGSELFQFPVVVVIDKNVARTAIPGSGADEQSTDICSFKESSVRISTTDINLNPVAARVSYQCFEQTCDLGQTKIQNGQAILDAGLPSCVNGYLIARAENYSDSKQLLSSNSETSADVVLDRAYGLDVNVMVDGKPLQGTAVVHFNGVESSSAILPDSAHVQLSEGSYNVSVYVYGNSSVVIPATTKKQCTTVAQGGIFGFFGGTKEECFDIQIPENKIEYALRGGGTANTYILPQELESGHVTLYVSSLPQPASLEQLQTNFELFNSMGVEISFT